MTELAESGPRLAVLLVVMAALTAAVYVVGRLGNPWTAPAAALRGAAQLAIVSAVLAAALAGLWSSFLVLAVMLLAAIVTSGRRARAGLTGAWLALPLVAGVGLVLPLMLVTGVVPLAGVAIVPVGGIVLGGAMNVTSLATRRSLDAVTERRGEVEAALAVGLTDRQARRLVLDDAAGDALLPGLDQTRTVGLVTLPGAFVGVLLASGSAAQAGAVQILVLVALLLAQSVAVVLAVELVARGVVRR